MRQHLIPAVLLISFLLFASILEGCTTENSYIQDLRTTGVMNRRPIRLIHDDSTWSAHISGGVQSMTTNEVTGTIEGHTMVSRDGSFHYYQVPNSNPPQYVESDDTNSYRYSGTNLSAVYPSITYSANASIALSKHFLLRAGGQYGILHNEENWSTNAGFGLYDAGKDWGVLLEGGFYFSMIRYNVSYAVLRKSFDFFGDGSLGSSDVQLGDASGTDHHTNYYLSLTLNTQSRTLPLNGFIRFSYDRQALIDLPLHGNTDINPVQHTAAYLNITPGLAFQFGALELIGGMQLTYIASLQNNASFLAPMPILELQF